MALETDVGHDDTTEATLVAITWNDTFSNAPDEGITFALELKKKSMIDPGSITTTGCDVGTEGDISWGMDWIVKEPGYDAGSSTTHPEMDSVRHAPASEKSLDSLSFNDTFTSIPVVICGYYGDDPDSKGGKVSCASITTTGCDVACEFKADTTDYVHALAIYTNGFWEV